MCDVSIPNKEISFIYVNEILNKTNQNGIAVSIQQAIFTMNLDNLQIQLEKFMLQSISYFDGANEGFYHGMMLGLLAILSNNYDIRSNREAGLGRFDIMLSPKLSSMPGFIFEFKYTNDPKCDLDILANEALTQIKDKKYDTGLLTSGINNIIKIGIAFCGKKAIIKSQ